MTETIADIGEFGLIDRIHQLIKRKGVKLPATTLGIGDDTASFSSPSAFELLLTCDCLVEGRHFLSKFIDPFNLGRRAMSVNISDIGAMGGLPLYALISLGLKAEMQVADVEAIYNGFLEELNPFKASIIGGNITKVEKSTFIDISLVGRVETGKIVLRSTARPGDLILVTGFPGQAAAGLRLLQHSRPEAKLLKNPLVQAYIMPYHRAWEGSRIANSGLATAMIDISDGLLGDLGHICQASGVGAELNQDKLPISEDLKYFAEQFELNPYELVLKDSDDYELIITCKPENEARLSSVITSTGKITVSKVGRVTDKPGEILLLLPDGRQERLTPSGWNHFAR